MRSSAARISPCRAASWRRHWPSGCTRRAAVVGFGLVERQHLLGEKGVAVAAQRRENAAGWPAKTCRPAPAPGSGSARVKAGCAVSSRTRSIVPGSDERACSANHLSITSGSSAQRCVERIERGLAFGAVDVDQHGESGEHVGHVGAGVELRLREPRALSLVAGREIEEADIAQRPATDCLAVDAVRTGVGKSPVRLAQRPGERGGDIARGRSRAPDGSPRRR